MKKSKKVAGNKKPASKNSQTDMFDFDDEIVIGITKKEDKPKKNKNVKNNKKAQKEKKQIEKSKKTNRKAVKIVRIIVLLIIIIGAIVYFMMSPVFDVKTITVTGNNKLSTEEIISIAEVNSDTNTFKINTKQAERKIKENPYIESVKVSRKLPSEITIELVERFPTYMLEYINSVVYINNQGYMLEITENKIPVPIISGISTPIENFMEGNRLNKEDLQKLETVLKIMDTLGSYDLAGLVTGINVADKNNYTIYLAGERKTVYLGNASNINTRIMYLKEILEREKGIESEIFINSDINKGDVYTREKV